MPRIQLGIIGSGGMSTRRAENFARRQDVNIRVIAARNTTTGPALASKIGVECVSDWQALLSMDDLDAVFVGTHNKIHGAITIAALEAGKHVFSEYPISRLPEEGRQIARLIAAPTSPVLRTTHNESISAEHTALKDQVSQMGPLLTSHFFRFTPGRGGRPEVLFNLRLSGPPALFFVYHVNTYVSLFGAAEWVHCAAQYDGLNAEEGYDRFVNTLTVGFASGGTGQWTWAGGIEIETAVQEARIVMREGTLIETDTGWDISLPSGTSPLAFGDNTHTLEDQFVADILDGETDWRDHAEVALNAAAIGHAAEISVNDSKVVQMGKCQ